MRRDLDEAQPARYRADREKAYGEKLRLRSHAVVGVGFERLVWE